MSDFDPTKFRLLRAQVGALLKCSSIISISRANQIEGLLLEMERGATVNAKNLYPKTPSYPPRPDIQLPELPSLPIPPEWHQANSDYSSQILVLQSRIDNPDGTKGWAKRIKRAMRELSEIKANMPLELEQIIIDNLSPDKRREYDAILTARKQANALLAHWNNALSSIRYNYDLAIRRWEVSSGNSIAVTQLKIVRNLYRDLETARKVGLAQEFIPISKVPWRMFPSPEPGQAGLSNLIDEVGNHCPQLKIDRTRLVFAYQLGPTHIYIGSGEFDGYLAFEFTSTERILLECPVTGNAAYIFRENWKILSRLSKTEILQNYRREVGRVVHDESNQWRRRIKAQLGM